MSKIALVMTLVLLVGVASIAAGNVPSNGPGDSELAGASLGSEEEQTGIVRPVFVFTDSTEVWQLARENGPVKDLLPLRGSFLAFLPDTLLAVIERREDVRAVAVVGVFPRARLELGYEATHAKRYWPVFVSTTSESARQLIAERALAEPGFGPPRIEQGDLGFVAWLPETLVPILEDDPEVGLDWTSQKLPLVIAD